MDFKKHLLEKRSPTYTSYYNGKMSYRLHGKEWKDFVTQNFADLLTSYTSENIFKDVVDAYRENLIPVVEELAPFKDALVPLLTRGEALGIVTRDGKLAFPEHFEVVSDGEYHVAAVFTRSLRDGKDYVTFIDSAGESELWAKDVPEDLSYNREGYQHVESEHGHTLFRFALEDAGMGNSLASLQDRINHSILDQTIIAEMYARPFWYLLNFEAPAHNPYLPESVQKSAKAIQEQKTGGAGGRIFATSTNGPFGQLEPPTIKDMVEYHNSLIRKVSQTSGIPEYYFTPATGNATSGRTLMVLSRRFNNRIARIRDAIEPVLLDIAELLGVKFEGDELYLWNVDTDIMQEAIDDHGIALKTMGFPTRYVAEVVAPGVNLDDYLDDGYLDENPSVLSSRRTIDRL